MAEGFCGDGLLLPWVLWEVACVFWMGRGCGSCSLGCCLSRRGQACPSSFRLEAPRLFSTVGFQGPTCSLGGFKSLGSVILQGSGPWVFWVVWGGGRVTVLPLSSRRSAAPTFKLGHQGKGPWEDSGTGRHK